MATIIPTLPKDMKIAVVRDQSEFIENSLNSIEEHLLLGGFFAAAVVLVFLWNFRTTLIAALAIRFDHRGVRGHRCSRYSLNQMTMLALTLMVGIVIDDAIVVLENIYRLSKRRE
jgi:HAE1 family hydrophobic/amphiphilic exporter-1